MNALDLFLDKQIQELDANVTVLAFCFLILGGVALFILPTGMYLFDEFLIKQYHITPVMETLPMIWMSEPFNWAGTLYKLLVIWTGINIVHSVCYCIDGLRDWLYFRKWGEHAN